MGGSTLDVLAADNPALVEYYFGDGGQRLARLMADALQGGRDVSQGVPARTCPKPSQRRRLRRHALGQGGSRIKSPPIEASPHDYRQSWE
ncbi:hypothetical protein [Nonomuraea sp. CA-141351]|uniref:hypothetical protein n=1 Tax=Nonomuraea sp. CA-141351 TaxID=3239996 RepID=UPI003D91D974